MSSLSWSRPLRRSASFDSVRALRGHHACCRVPDCGRAVAGAGANTCLAHHDDRRGNGSVIGTTGSGTAAERALFAGRYFRRAVRQTLGILARTIEAGRCPGFAHRTTNAGLRTLRFRCRPPAARRCAARRGRQRPRGLGYELPVLPPGQGCRAGDPGRAQFALCLSDLQRRPGLAKNGGKIERRRDAALRPTCRWAGQTARPTPRFSASS